MASLRTSSRFGFLDLCFHLASYMLQRRLDRNVFLVLKEITDANARLTPAPAESLRDILLRDTLPRAAENDHTTFQAVLNNVQTFVEVVHHQMYSPDLMACE